jgi:protein-disulfide isomerase
MMNARGALLLLFAACAACGGGRAPAPEMPPLAPLAASIVAAPPPSASASAAPSEEGPSEEEVAVPISVRNPSWGSRTAPVTIVEFGDFECPFCSRAEATLARIRETYGPGTVRIVWKNNPLPFHRNAQSAAEAATGVFVTGGNVAFWKFHDFALRSSGLLAPQAYDQWANDAGVTDRAALRTGLATHLWAEAVQKDMSEGKALGVFGTPTFFVNGLPLAGALPFPTFQGVIDRQVRAAQAKISAGTPQGRVYAELVRDNRASGAADQDDDDDVTESKTIYKVPLGRSPVRGSSTALVTLVEFADYQCPYCIRAEPIVSALRAKYGDKLRVVFKDAPLSFHSRAEPAAEAALEVRAEKGDAAFWAIHDELLAGSGEPSDEALVQLAARLGARAESVKAAIVNHAHKKSIDADTDVSEDFAANGTPHFFINGRRLAGAQPTERFEAIIDEEILRAQALLANGTRPEAIYDALVRDGTGATLPEKKSLATPFPGHDPIRGGPAARVTVHEWSDFQCPFCARVEPALQQVVREYGPRVKLVWHDLPLPMHADARLAARAAREALAQKGIRAFWAMHDEIFAHQNHLGREDLDGYARSLGLDMAKWVTALDEDAHQTEIDADKDAADAMNITATPAFVIVPAGAQSGYYIDGAQAYAKFRRRIDRALAEAQ